MPGVVLPRVIGHRGAAARAPENTLAGLRVAAAAGVRWVEIDLRVTRDGRCAVLHDPTLERTTDGRGRLAARDADDLARLDAGGWFAPRFAGEPLPLLEDALALADGLDLGLNLELKRQPGREAACIAAVAAALARRPRPRERLLLSSFDPLLVDGARATLPEVPRAAIVGRGSRGWRGRVARGACAALHVDARGLTARRCALVKAAGLTLAAYTVNDPDRALELWGWGVDAVFSDVPDVLLAAAPDA